MRDAGNRSGLSTGPALPTTGMRAGDEFVFNNVPYYYTGSLWVRNIIAAEAGATPRVDLPGIVRAPNPTDYRASNSLTNARYPGIPVDQSALPYLPFAAYNWSDILGNSKLATPTVEKYVSGAWATSAQDVSHLFSGIERVGINVVNGTTESAVRFTWAASAFSWANIRWLMIGFDYRAEASNRTVLFETSADNTTWTQRHLSTGSADNYSAAYFHLLDNGGDGFLRLTITQVAANVPVTLTEIKLLAHRKGSGTTGKELEVPYQWDGQRRMAIGRLAQVVNASLSLGSPTGTTADQGLYFGNDSNLYRSGPGQVKTDGQFLAGGGIVSLAATGIEINAADASFRARGGAAAIWRYRLAVVGESFDRFRQTADGTQQWGSGAADTDTFLYRSGQYSLHLQGNLNVSSSLTVGGVAVVTTDDPRLSAASKDGVATVTYVQTGTSFDAGTYSGGVATAASNGALDPSLFNANSLAVGDRLLVRSMTVAEDFSSSQLTGGIYRIVAVGSASAPWQLERTTDYPTIASNKGIMIVALNGLGNTAMSQWTLVDLGVFLANPALAGKYAVVAIQTQPNADKALEVDAFGNIGVKFGSVTGTAVEGNDARLSLPSPNMIRDSSFDKASDTTHLTSLNSTLALEATAANVRNGVGKALRITVTSTSQWTAEYQGTSHLAPCNPGDKVMAAAHFKGSSATLVSAGVGVAFYNAAGTKISGGGAVYASYVDNTGYVRVVSTVATAPANTAFCAPMYMKSPTGSSTVGGFVYVDDVSLHFGTVMPPHQPNTINEQDPRLVVANARVTTPLIPLSLTSNFSAYGSGYNTPAYYKDANGRVHLQGLLRPTNTEGAGMSVGKLIATLPPGYRPSLQDLDAAFGDDAAKRIDITANGEIYAASTFNSGGFLSLAGYSFLAADGPYSGTIAQERIVRGQVNANGTTSLGTGFTVTRTAVGRYTVTFTTPFPGGIVPIVNIISDGSGAERNVRLGSFSNTGASFPVEIYDNNSINYADAPFTFEAKAISPALAPAPTSTERKLNEITNPDGSVSMAGQRLTTLAAPVLNQDAAHKLYVDTVYKPTVYIGPGVANGYWNGGADLYLSPGTWTAPANGRLYFGTYPVDTRWEISLQMLLRADSANWTQIQTRIYVYNGASQPQADFYSYGESNGGKGFGDWLTMNIVGMPFVIPANSAGWFADPLALATPYGGFMNRTYNYNNFVAKRIY